MYVRTYYVKYAAEICIVSNMYYLLAICTVFSFTFWGAEGAPILLLEITFVWLHVHDLVYSASSNVM